MDTDDVTGRNVLWKVHDTRQVSVLGQGVSRGKGLGEEQHGGSLSPRSLGHEGPRQESPG